MVPPKFVWIGNHRKYMSEKRTGLNSLTKYLLCYSLFQIIYDTQTGKGLIHLCWTKGTYKNMGSNANHLPSLWLLCSKFPNKLFSLFIRIFYKTWNYNRLSILNWKQIFFIVSDNNVVTFKIDVILHWVIYTQVQQHTL